MPDTLVDANIMSALPVFCEKIVFVGDARSGKSSVIDRYIHNSFSPDPDPTLSMRLGTKSWAVSEPSACVVNVELWDTQRGFGKNPAGEEFWRGTRAVVVCVDGQSSSCSSSSLRWLTGDAINECRKYEPSAIIFLLATKSDTLSERRENDIQDELQSFVDQRLCTTWALVSAKTMKGIYDKEDFLKQLLHALISQDIKAHKNRSRRSSTRQRQSLMDNNNRQSIRSSIRASAIGGPIKDVVLRLGSTAPNN